MKVHFLSDSIKMNSGYAVVCRNLAIGLKKMGYAISMTGSQTAYASEYFDDMDGGKIEVMPIQSDKADDIGQLMNNIMNIGPDVVIFVGQMDIDLNPLAKVYPGTWVYCPVEGKDVPFGIVSDLNGIVKKGGKVIAMCRYGFEEMKRAGVNVNRYIYHGYNSGVFRKIDVKDRGVGVKSGDVGTEIVSILKWNDENKKWSQHDTEIGKVGDMLGYGHGKFMYLHVGQNVGIRKRQERLLMAYAMLTRDNRMMKDRTRLHMHCLPISGRGLNLIEVAMKLGIKENVSFSYGNYLSAGWSEESLNVLYNLADVHISASSSEGFGLPTLESMACGLPNIAPDCTSFTELIGNDPDENKNRGLLAKISDWQMEPIGRYKPLVSEKDLAEKMKRLYSDEKLRDTLGNNGMEWVRQWSWDKIVEKWNEMLESS